MNAEAAARLAQPTEMSMPFGLGNRKTTGVVAPRPDVGAVPLEAELAAEPAPETEPEPPPGIAFDGFTEDWRIVGRMVLTGRSADALGSIARSLNNRDPVELHDPQWALLDDRDQLQPAPGLAQMAPYDMVAIIAGGPGEPPMTSGEFEVYKVRKTASPVELDLPPFRVIGSHFVEGRAEATHLLRRDGPLFVPISEARLYRGDELVSDPEIDIVLVNRLYIKGVRVLDMEWLETWAERLGEDSPLAHRIKSMAARPAPTAPPRIGAEMRSK